MAHDYRLNPFTDTMDSVDITEYYVLPVVSPFTIRTGEVPEKTSPSTLIIKEVTSFSGGVPVYGRTFSEVAATPAAGQFYPDYHTGAGGDDNWNTGLILFNSADAGIVVEVTYKGTGTLVSITGDEWPAWMKDKGTGTDGAYNPATNTTLAAGTYNFTSVNINAGITVTCTGKVYIKCQGNFVNNGTFAVSPTGASGGASPGSPGGTGPYTGKDGNPGANGYGGGNGGAGAMGWDGHGYLHYAGGAGGYSGYGISDPALITGGSGGGSGGTSSYNWAGEAGGNGGGVIIIVANNILNAGTISANGGNGAGVVGDLTSGSIASGGGGGGIVIMASSALVPGTITVNGGAGGNGHSGYANSGTAGRVISALIRSV